MTVKIQVIIAIIVIIALSIIVNMIRKKRLELRYALAWLIVGVGTLVLDCFPKLIKWISDLVGIAAPVNMLFFFGFCLSIVIIFTLSIALSNLTDKVKKMAQEIAIIRKDMYERYNGNNRENSGGN